MKKVPSKERRYSADELMRKTALALVRDFQTNLRNPCFCSDFQRSLSTGSVAEIRNSVPAVNFDLGVAEFKATYQLNSLLKRYRYQNDIYSDNELTEKAVSSFRETQSRLAALDLSQLRTSSQLILDLAANYIRQILGEYSDEEHRSLCRFGKKASVGIPARLACEAERWQIPISGSPDQITWFDSEMSRVVPVQNYWQAQLTDDPNGSVYQVTTSLTLSLVPKTFKSLRSIMPNTTIGSYMSFGLGEMIRRRLKRAGYDITSLQMRHRYLARQSSQTLLSVTADLSSASDSISVALVERLFPADWLRILHLSRIGLVQLPDGSICESLTFCTMGIGYTFPLQTLVFLALLKAIEASQYDRFDRRLISVYGDDLIYSRRMHRRVLRELPEFGFIINEDKTFCDEPFRESCGGDYYHGVDVRPFQPRNGPAYLGSKAYEAMLYKYINGLLMRWDEHEIGGTLDVLVSEIEAVTGKCKLVPCDYPDESGIKCPTLSFYEFLERAKCCKPKHIGHGVFRFSFLRFEPFEREETRHEPYLWLALRDHIEVAYYGNRRCDRERPTPYQSVINDCVGIKDIVSPLIWKEKHPIRCVRIKRGPRLRRLSAFVTISHTGRYRRQSGTSCFEDRR